MITTKEFFENDADDIILELESHWTVQRDGDKRFINDPFPSKEDFFENYEYGLNDPYDELADYDDLSDEEIQQMIQKQKNRISATYDVVKKIRDEFEEKKGVKNGVIEVV